MNSKENLQKAMAYAMANRPKIGGFPYFAECLRKVGVTRNIWSLPAAQSIFIMDDNGSVVNQGAPLLMGMAEIPRFNKDALIAAIRIDQAGESTFPEFLSASWGAGVVNYEVDFEKRTVTYTGAKGESYTESYSAVDVPGLVF